jgi:hypothetical protein
LLGSIYMDDVKSPTAIEAMLPYFKPESGSREQGVLAAALSRASMLSDRQADAIRLADQAIDTAEAAVDPATFVDAFITKATSLGNLGHTFEATLMLDGAIDFAEDHDLGFSAGRAINNLMIITTNDGWTRYGDYARRGMEVGTRMGDLTSQRMAANLAWWLTMMLRLDEAAAVLDAEDFETGSQGVAAYARYTRGLLDWLREGVDEALDEARAGANAFVAMEEAQWSESGNDQLALISLLSGDYRAAFDRALTVKLLAASWMFPKETALSAAMLMGDREAFRQAVDSTAEYTIPGRKREAIELQIRAGKAVFDGAEEDAVVAFTRWIELLQNHFFTMHLQEARALFAMLVPDAPESLSAATAAYRELSDAGAYHLLEMWRDAFPAPEAERAG